MMRWLFAVLVLANVGLFMWVTWHRGDAGGTISPRPLFHPELMVPISAPGVTLKSRRNEKPSSPLLPAKPKMRCITIGPFSPSAAEPAGAWLQAEQFEHAPRNEERQIENSYWVHLGPFENRKQAEKRLKELEKLGVRDLLIMQDREGGVAISLGLFSLAENARIRQQELADKGVTAKQEVRYKTEKWLWLDVRTPEPADSAVAKLRAHDWSGKVEIQDRACPVEPAAAPVAKPAG